MKSSGWGSNTALALLCGMSVSVAAQAQTQAYDIAAGDLKTALDSFVARSGVQLIYKLDDVAGRRSHGVKAQLPAEAALAALLGGSGLQLRREAGNAFVIFPVAAPAAAATAATAADDTALATVMVTAQKRPQTLLEVPSAVLSMSGERLRELGVNDFVALSQYTPGLVASNQLVGGRTVQTFTIRGIGNDDFRPNGSPSAAVHFDGVYMGSSALIGGQMFDVARVEVLKGPQGTLYGRNTTAGAINVISRKPGRATEGQASLTVGDYGNVRSEAAVGTPLDEHWSVRLAGVYDRSDGYQTNLGPGAYGGVSAAPAIAKNAAPAADAKSAASAFSAARALIAFKPVDGSSLLLNLHGFHESGGAQLPERTLASGKFAPNAPYTVDSNITPALRKDSHGASLTLDQELPGELLLSLLTGYEHLQQSYRWNDGQPIRYFDIDYADRVDQRLLEARLRNLDGAERGLDWVLGAMLFHDSVDMRSALDSSDYLRTVYATDYRQSRDSQALFGDLSKTIGQYWSVGLGLRYTTERSGFAGSSLDLNPYATSLNRLAFPKVPVHFDEHFRDGRWSGKGTLSYRATPATMLYASFGQGFKAGGFDGSTITSREEALPFQSETVRAYEGGVKYLPNGPLQVDASLFYYDYRDMQASSVRNIANVPTGVRTNVAKASIVGAELNVVARPMRGLDLVLGLSTLRSSIADVASDDPLERARRLRSKLPNTPAYTASATVRYQRPVGAGTVLVSSLSGRWIDKYYGELDNFQAIGGDFVGDARLELRFGSRWSLAGWVKNLTDSRRYSGVGTVTATTAPLLRAAPRTVGLTTTASF
ncbi:TonB-dependent receptor [Rugamonas rubra]|uniref:Iron complex outermembrane recepter protein n=1 Tax=Rugamonas rubra TaxID=758825 RepID=A0A1I4QXN2_9BURK|nr:TonB-dependent receptor [Rugamonas rubra]SFM44761.1 iron complex outermembrane recepter protein [Rugamonas rubra]